MHAMPLSVVISQGQSANPLKRKLEEDLVAALLLERGLEVTVVPHLYDLKADGTGMLCLQGIKGPMIVLSWLYGRAAHWVLDRNGIRGHVGQTLLDYENADDEPDEDDTADQQEEDKQRVTDLHPRPDRSIWYIDLRVRDTIEPFVAEVCRIRDESRVQTVDLMSFVQGAPKPEQLERFIAPAPGNVAAVDANGAGGDAPAAVRVVEEAARRWYPVIDFSRCTNCMECIDFCLFGVYGVDRADTILVEQPDNCRKGCPACSRVCPENAIIFPQHKSPAIAGSPEGEAGALKIDLSKLFGAPDALDLAVHERDVELVAAGRDAVGMSVGIPKRQPNKPTGPKDKLDSLIDELDALDL